MPHNWRYFKETEIQGLDVELVAKLDLARGKAGIPFVITSGARNAAENERAMGVESSSHLSGLAVDLACSGSQDRYRMVAALLEVGFKRLGIYERHVHADTDMSKPQSVMWMAAVP